MASPNPDQGGFSSDREAALRARIAELEARLESQAAELETTYAMLGRERAAMLRAEAALRQERRLLDALIDQTPIGIQIFDREGYALRLNEAQRALLGLPDRTYGVGTFNALSDPLQIISGAAEGYRRAYAGERVSLSDQVMDLSISANTWQMARRVIRFNQLLVPILDERGRVEAIVSFNEDASEIYATRQALSTANQLIEGLFEHAPLALQIYDRKGFSFRMNELNRRLLGVPSREYGVGKFNALTDPFMIAQGHAALFARAYAGEVVRVPALSIELTDPSNAWSTERRTARIEQTLFPILDDEGNVSAVVSCIIETGGGPQPQA